MRISCTSQEKSANLTHRPGEEIEIAPARGLYNQKESRDIPAKREPSLVIHPLSATLPPPQTDTSRIVQRKRPGRGNGCGGLDSYHTPRRSIFYSFSGDSGSPEEPRTPRKCKSGILTMVRYSIIKYKRFSSYTHVMLRTPPMIKQILRSGVREITHPLP